MAYEAEQDRIRAILPGSFVLLRPALRINCEIINDGEKAEVEFNTAVEKAGVRGWLNIACFDTEKGIIRDNGAVTIERISENPLCAHRGKRRLPCGKR